VLGASIYQVIGLISNEFFILILISFIISIPLVWYSVRLWLQNFAYRIEMSVWIFASAGIIALLIAALTISVQSVRAAIANPVDSIKSE
jgi:putative ABC transport system permease protein